MKIRKLQILRRAVQFLVLLIIVAIPTIARYGNYLAARELDKNLRKWDGTLQGATLGAVDTVLRSLPGGEKERAGRTARNRDQVLSYAQGFAGGPWSVQLAGLSMTDPLAAAECVVASRRAATVLLTSLIVPIVVTLLLGRVFCSWICPMHLLLEFTDKLRAVLKYLELPTYDLKFSRGLKYILLGVGLAMAAWWAMPVLGYVYPPAIIGRELHDLVFSIFDRAEAGKFGFSAAGLTWMTLVIVGIAAFEVTVSRRWWCRYICPGGAIYVWLGWLRPIRVKLAETKCTRCEDCIEVCPYGLNPMDNLMGAECDNCGRCISHCAPDALDYALAGPRKGTTSPTAKESSHVS